MRLSKMYKYIGIAIVLFIIIYCLLYYDIDSIKLYIIGLGAMAPIGIFFLRFTSVIIPILPSTAYSLLAGFLFGFQHGIVLICISDLIACSTSFLIARKYGRNAVKKVVSDKFMFKVEKFSTTKIERNFFLMTGLLMTGLFDFVSYGIGLTKIRWTRFLPSLIISICLSNPPVVALGAGVFYKGKQFLVLSVLAVFVLALVTYLIQRENNKHFTA